MTDINLDWLQSTCRSFYDQGIRAAAEIVREAAHSCEPLTLEQVADLLDSLPDTSPKAS